MRTIEELKALTNRNWHVELTPGELKHLISLIEEAEEIARAAISLNKSDCLLDLDAPLQEIAKQAKTFMEKLK